MNLPFDYKYKDNFSVYSNVESSLLFSCVNFDKETPLFSILIPTYKRPELLENSFLHALKQTTDKKYEIIICDNDKDFDSLDSLHLIERLCKEEEVKKNINIYYFKNEDNLGQIGNWNRLIALSSGKYLLMCHDDDWVDQRILKTAEKYLDRNMGLSFIIKTTDFRKKQTAAQKLRKALVFAAKTVSKVISSRKAYPLSTYDIFVRYMNPGNCGVIFEREKLIELGGYYQDVFPFTDLYTFAMYSMKYGIIHVKKPRAFYRIAANESLTAAVKFPLYRYEFMNSLIPFIKDEDKQQLEHIAKCTYVYYSKDAALFWGIEEDKIPVPDDLDVADSSVQKDANKIARKLNVYASRRYF